MQQQPETSEVPADPQMLPSLASSGQAPALARIQGTVLMAIIHCQLEGLSFLGRRCKQDLRLMDGLIASVEVGDAFHVWYDFCLSALDDYARGAAEIANVGVRFVSATAMEMRREAAAMTENMAARTVAP